MFEVIDQLILMMTIPNERPVFILLIVVTHWNAFNTPEYWHTINVFTDNLIGHEGADAKKYDQEMIQSHTADQPMVT